MTEIKRASCLVCAGKDELGQQKPLKGQISSLTRKIYMKKLCRP